MAAVSVFHYWNLSSQYDDLVSKMAELQEVMRTSSLKRVSAEKHAEDLQQRLRDIEDDLGKTKLEGDAKTAKLATALRRMQDRGGDINEQLRTQLNDAQQMAIKSRNVSLEEISNLRFQLDSMTLEYNGQVEKNSALQATIEDLRKQLSSGGPHFFQPPPVRPFPGAKTVKDIPGQLSIISSDKVHVWTKGLTGVTVHQGGPMVFLP